MKVQSVNQSSNSNNRISRIEKCWWLIFLIYATALTVGTHWPALNLGTSVQSSDKVIHVVAFGILTILLWLTRWIERWWVVGVVTLTWATLDELSQAVPLLHRTASLQDLTANVIGVVLAMTIVAFISHRR